MARSRGSSGGAATAPPRSDAYVGILAISLVAMFVAVVLLFLEWNSYDGKAPPKAPPVNVKADAPTPPAGPADGGAPGVPGPGAPAPAGNP